MRLRTHYLGEEGRRASAFLLRNLLKKPHESGMRPRLAVIAGSTLGVGYSSSLWSLAGDSALMSSGYLQEPHGEVSKSDHGRHSLEGPYVRQGSEKINPRLPCIAGQAGKIEATLPNLLLVDNERK